MAEHFTAEFKLEATKLVVDYGQTFVSRGWSAGSGFQEVLRAVFSGIDCDMDVRRNRGPPGCDGQTLKRFDQQCDDNLYRTWGRLCSGTWFLSPVLEKRILMAIFSCGVRRRRRSGPVNTSIILLF